jgi:hypothetical protein
VEDGVWKDPRGRGCDLKTYLSKCAKNGSKRVKAETLGKRRNCACSIATSLPTTFKFLIIDA